MLTGWATEAFLQLLQQLFLLLVQAYRCFDDNAAQQITLCATADRLDAFTAHTEKLTGLGFAGHFQFDATIRVGTSISPPSAAIAKLIGTSQ